MTLNMLFGMPAKFEVGGEFCGGECIIEIDELYRMTPPGWIKASKTFDEIKRFKCERCQENIEIRIDF